MKALLVFPRSVDVLYGAQWFDSIRHLPAAGKAPRTGGALRAGATRDARGSHGRFTV
jgi:hypothetical protein